MPNRKTKRSKIKASSLESYEKQPTEEAYGLHKWEAYGIFKKSLLSVSILLEAAVHKALSTSSKSKLKGGRLMPNQKSKSSQSKVSSLESYEKQPTEEAYGLQK